VKEGLKARFLKHIEEHEKMEKEKKKKKKEEEKV
jgi:hypothetical protein